MELPTLLDALHLVGPDADLLQSRVLEPQHLLQSRRQLELSVMLLRVIVAVTTALHRLQTRQTRRAYNCLQHSVKWKSWQN